MTYRYTVQSIGRKQDVLLLTLAPVDRALQFEAGQYAAISFKRNGRPTPMRCFSIISTPGSGVLQFAMRVRGRFTGTAAALQHGDIVQVQGPFGEFTVDPEYDRRVVMLAGGIGITPYLSILRDLTERHIALPVNLLFANRSAASTPFADQLHLLAQQNPYLDVRFFTNDTTGNINAEHIRQQTAPDTGDTTYFICGPKHFTAGMRSLLVHEGVHESRIVIESFAQSSGVTLGRGWSVPKLTYAFSATTFALAVGAVMALDLSRAVPKARAQAAPTSNTVTQAPASNSTSGSSSSSPTATAQTQTTAPTPTTTPTTAQPNQTYYNYQPPVSTVS